MEADFPPPDQDQALSKETSLANGQGDRIVVGNLDHTVAAIGRGASVIYQQALSMADQARAKEDFEHEKLAEAVGRLINTLYDTMRKTVPATGSPYKYLLPFEFNDAWRFFGREDFQKEVISAIGCFDLRCRLAVLHGDAGMGKTSFLRASMAPALVAAGHLPLLLRASHEPLSTSVKQSLLPNLASLEFLQTAPLIDFLRHVHELLPGGAQVYVLVDQFEEFFEQPRLERENFVSELADCLFTEPAAGHWLLSIQSARVGYLSTLMPEIPHPLANTLVLPPLTNQQARDAILKPAELAGYRVEESLVDLLLQELGGDAIDPSKLQLVCHTLAQSTQSEQKFLNLTAYEKAGRAEAILRDHLTLVLKHNLPPEDAEPAWQALAAIAEKPAGETQDEVLSELNSHHIPREQALRVLEMLESNRLIRLREQVYRLTSTSLLVPVQDWANQRAALEQAQVEARRQLEHVRDSALRGLFGGAAGFMLAYLITHLDQTVDWLVLPIVTLFDGLLGGVAGIIFIFGLDVARASFHGRIRWMQVLWGGLAGAIVFAAAFLIHKLLHFPADERVLLAAVEGSLWGLVAGAGTAAVLLSTRPYWQTVVPFAILSAIALWVGEGVGYVYRRPRIEVGGRYLGVWVLLAGALMFLSLACATVWGKRREASSPEPESQPNR